MSDFVCMTRIERSDCIEGQVYHIGTLDECKKIQGEIPAIAISDDRPVLDTHICVFPMPEDIALETGKLYRWPKPTEEEPDAEKT